MDPEVVPAGSHAYARLSHPFCGAVNHRREQEQTTGKFAEKETNLSRKRDRKSENRDRKTTKQTKTRGPRRQLVGETTHIDWKPGREDADAIEGGDHLPQKSSKPRILDYCVKRLFSHDRDWLPTTVSHEH